MGLQGEVRAWGSVAQSERPPPSSLCFGSSHCFSTRSGTAGPGFCQHTALGAHGARSHGHSLCVPGSHCRARRALLLRTEQEAVCCNRSRRAQHRSAAPRTPQGAVWGARLRKGRPDPHGPIPCHRATIEGAAVWARRFCLRLRKGEAVKRCSPRPPRAARRCGSSFLNEGLLLAVHLQDPGCGVRLCCAGTLLEMPAALRVSCCPPPGCVV